MGTSTFNTEPFYYNILENFKKHQIFSAFVIALKYDLYLFFQTSSEHTFWLQQNAFDITVMHCLHNLNIPPQEMLKCLKCHAIHWDIVNNNTTAAA